MAQLFPAGLRLFDANGNPLSGAKVRVYTANTTTLVSLFSDAALSSAITNPVITDSAGYPANGGNECAIYVAAGTYDVAFLDSSNNVLASWDDYSPSGEAGDFERTVSGNGRIKITGSGGAVQIQAGDPSPDNTGGTLTIEGQAGTQGDALTLDFAAVNAGTSGGALKENSKKLIGTVYTEATAFSAASTVEIPLTADPTGALAWEIEVWDFVMSASANLRARLSYDGGGTYKSGASDYFGHWVSLNSGGASPTADLTAAQMQLLDGLAGTTARPGVINIRVLTVPSGSNATRLTSRADGVTGAPALAMVFSNWFCEGGYGKATHLRLFGASGTITGKYLVRPLRGYGET